MLKSSVFRYIWLAVSADWKGVYYCYGVVLVGLIKMFYMEVPAFIKANNFPLFKVIQNMLFVGLDWGEPQPLDSLAAILRWDPTLQLCCHFKRIDYQVDLIRVQSLSRECGRNRTTSQTKFSRRQLGETKIGGISAKNWENNSLNKIDFRRKALIRPCILILMAIRQTL